MKSRVAPLILLFGAALASSKTNSKCSKDGCARALTGTRLGTNHPSIAKADCSSFFQKITTPTITVVVTNTVATATTLIPAKRQLPTPGIPFYARVCTEPGSYASACSCLGVSQCTSAASVSAFYFWGRPQLTKASPQPLLSLQMWPLLSQKKAPRRQRLHQYLLPPAAQTPSPIRSTAEHAAISARLAYVRTALAQ